MNLGDRIRQLRQNKSLSVRQFAGKVGVTASFIYQLEQNKVAPSFSTLKSIAEALNTSIAVLVEDELPEEWVIARRDRRLKIKTADSKLNLELLSFPGARNKKMQPLFFEVEPGAYQVHVPSFGGEHEDFIYVMQGEIEINTHNAKYKLEEGDAAYLMFDDLATVTNLARGNSKGLWIISPPGI